MRHSKQVEAALEVDEEVLRAGEVRKEEGGEEAEAVLRHLKLVDSRRDLPRTLVWLRSKLFGCLCCEISRKERSSLLLHLHYQGNFNNLRLHDIIILIFFMLCRKRCDINADSMSSVDMLTESEKSHVHTFFGKCIKKLTESDQQLPQVNHFSKI
jgi:hypothetical protein